MVNAIDSDLIIPVCDVYRDNNLGIGQTEMHVEFKRISAYTNHMIIGIIDMLSGELQIVNIKNDMCRCLPE